jgi:hypothetical protein
MSSPVITIFGEVSGWEVVGSLGVGRGDFYNYLGDLLRAWRDCLRFWMTLWDWAFGFLGWSTIDLVDLVRLRVLFS